MILLGCYIVVSLFPSSVFQNGKEEMLDVVQAQLINKACLLCHGGTHGSAEGCLVCPDLLQGAQMQVSSSWGNACMSLAQATTDQIRPLRTKNEQMLSKLSEMLFSNKPVGTAHVGAALCTVVSQGDLPALLSLFSAFQNAHGFLRPPVGFSDVNSGVCNKTTG